MANTAANVRPIFFYNNAPKLGGVLSLHLFEPRYRPSRSPIICANHHDGI